MRILFDYSAFVMQSRGGVSRVLFEAFQHVLQMDDIECFLFAGFHKNQYLRDASPEVKEHIIGWYLPQNSKATFFHASEPLTFYGFCQKIPA